MKRIIDGVTYNTETSTKLAQAKWDDDGDVVGILYQTRGGAYFVHLETTRRVYSPKADDYVIKVKDEFEPLSTEGAEKWIMEGDVEIFHNPFQDPPEATAEAKPHETLYVRLPVPLKRRIEAAAAKENVSGNVWAMRCLERCLS
jgi:hypothetical protein